MHRLVEQAGSLWRNKVVRRVLILVALVLAYQLWLSIQTIGKVDEEVGLDPEPNGRFAVDVRLDFAPERFHILELQQHGRVSGSDGETVHLRGVSDAGVDALAHFYWIEEISPGEGRTS
ncbi:hypothetical protein [Nocardioides albus]|uniref:Uncharacterized protein n=1 Tax=Nocardioides albus TaxID=1841 RepID=A0A7W5A405_9ACTN|nr:hypothetical protein [Nocardioides albus]MBB3089302.1 hypothetical protein [Nocardioides albus]GGU12891.1 hypothetical protein GCM10007979_08840 [Nocardioides albus]